VLDVTEDEVYMLKFIDNYVLPERLRTVRSSKDSRFKSNAISLFENSDFENITFKLNKMAQYQIELYETLENEIDTINTLINSVVHD
jgi:hypothetical protein